jgi:RNA polymerase sigma-70 factor (ECF subfamily)
MPSPHPAHAQRTEQFVALMRRHNQRLYRAARAIVRDPSEAEDVLQEGYVAAFEHLPGLREGDDSVVAAWLTRIVVNTAISRMRARGRWAATPLDEEGAEMVRIEAQTPEDDASKHELRALLEQAIEDLPDHYRLVFVLREVEGLSTADTATSLEISQEVVKTRLHRARNLLKEGLHARVGPLAPSTYEFGAARCDRLVARVLELLSRH